MVMPKLSMVCCRTTRTCANSVRWCRSIIPCDDDECAGAFRTATPGSSLATACAIYLSTGSLSTCSVVPVLPSSRMKLLSSDTGYGVLDLVGSSTAKLYLVATSMAVSTGRVGELSVLRYAKSTCITSERSPCTCRCCESIALDFTHALRHGW